MKNSSQPNAVISARPAVAPYLRTAGRESLVGRDRRARRVVFRQPARHFWWLALLWSCLPALAGNDRVGNITGTVWMNGHQQAVAQAVVYLGGLRHLSPAPAPPITLDQQRHQFLPRLQLARAGAPLIIQNSDPLLHVLRVELLKGANPPARLLRLATPYAGFEKRWTLPAADEPALVRVRGENGDERMTAYIAVMPHPWAAITDAQGRFRIEAVPAGEQRLFAWHETLGTLAGRVRVARGRTSEVQFDFPRAP